MQLESRGERVRKLQIQLNNWGFPPNGERDLEVNGIFDAQTQKAVLDFQKYYGLKPDGIVGTKTWEMLWSPRVSVLIKLLKHNDPNLRIRGSSQLREMGTRISSRSVSGFEESGYSRVGQGDIQSPDVKAAIPDLVALLKDQNIDVRLSAAHTLVLISSKFVPALATPTLIELLKDKNPKVRQAAVITLDYLLPDAATIAVNPIIKLLNDKDPKVILYAFLFLENIDISINSQILAAVNPLIDIVENKNDPSIKTLQTQDINLRARAANFLGDLKAETAVDSLIKSLKDEDNHVRISAAEALVKIQVEAAVNPLIKLLEDKDKSVRANAARLLGNIKAEAAVNPLIKLLKDEDDYVRATAIEALSNINQQVAVEYLMKLLENPDEFVRIEAVELLGNMQAQAVVEPLIELLEDNSKNVRASVAEALAKISAAEALAKIQVEAAINPLIELLEDKDKSVRANAARLLGNIKAEAAFNPLIKLLEDEDDYVRATAIEALSNINAEAAIVFIKAVELLVNLKAKAAVNPFVDIPPLPGEDSRKPVIVRKLVIEALSNINQQVAVEYLMKLLENPDEFVRIEAVELLGNMQAQAVVEPLIELLEDNSKNVRASVAEALGNTKAQAAIEPLIKHLKDKNEVWEVRLNAFAALAKIGSEAQAAIDPIVKLFVVEALQENHPKDDSPDEVNGFNEGMPPYKRRAFFFTTIEPGTLPSLNKALREILTSKDYDYKVRYSAAFILGYLDFSSETITILKSVVNNPSEDFDIRWMSAFSLAKLGQDMNQFFATNNLINPMQVICPKNDELRNVFNPFTGWCESKTGGGAGVAGWVEIFQEMLGRRKKN